MRKKTLLFVLAALCWGCDSAFNPEYSLAWTPPVVYSVILTEENGTGIGAIREITFSDNAYGYQASMRVIDFDEVKDLSTVATPLIFEEQEGPRTALSFSIPSTSLVHMYVMPARFPFEDESTVFRRVQNSSVVELRKGGVTIFEGVLSADSHSIPFNASTFPSGPYVYYIETEDETLSREFILFRECREAHPQLRPYISQCN